MFESLAVNILLNSVGVVVVGALGILATAWCYSEITYLKNKIKNLK